MPHREIETSTEELYAGLRTFLALIAERRFRVPADEAESLVHDVFAAYLQRRPAVRNRRAWFIGAICHACRHYWRKRARFVPFEEAEERAVLYEARDIAHLTAQRLLRGLRPREVHVLWMRFAEGRTIHDLGVQLGLTRSGAEKILRRALRRLSEHAVAAPHEDEEIHWLRWSWGAPSADSDERQRQVDRSRARSRRCPNCSGLSGSIARQRHRGKCNSYMDTSAASALRLDRLASVGSTRYSSTPYWFSFGVTGSGTC